MRAIQSPENGKLQKKSYDFDSKDFFWAKNAGNPFPQVAEDIDSELNRYALESCCALMGASWMVDEMHVSPARYKADAAEITRSTGVSDVNDVSQM
jgi:hypothetical protein